MTLSDLKTQFLNQTINIMQLGHKLKHYQTELDQLYPHDGSTSAKFWAYVYGDDQVWCDRSNKFKTFDGWLSGFRKFCGNQSTCVCNKEHQHAVRASRSTAHQQNINQKRKVTNQTKYGFDFASQSPEVKSKAESTCMIKYGAKSPMCNPQVLEKSSQTCFDNYGVAWPQQNAHIFEKTAQVFQDLYGVNRPAQAPAVREELRKMRRQDGFDTLLVKYPHIQPMFTQDEYADGDFDSEFKWKCISCSNEFTQTKRPHEDPRCLICQPLKETWGETVIKLWLQKHQVEFTQWDRSIIKPQELDFFIPQKMLAIEFNGTWHHKDDSNRSRAYHQLKWKAATDAGVKLIQVWEHELKHKPEIIFDRLSHALGFNSNKIAARKCTIHKLDVATSRSFFNSNHLQGHQNSKYVWGLYYDTLLVAAASFVQTRYNKTAECELLRYATIQGSQVQGGLGKLLAHAQKELKFSSLITYANLNWGQGAVYQAVGFQFSHISKPNYWYFKGLDQIHSRVKFQKHKIIGQASGVTEKEIAQNMGYYRFFDAGNAVWIKRW